jgi:hypothetical protein
MLSVGPGILLASPTTSIVFPYDLNLHTVGDWRDKEQVIFNNSCLVLCYRAGIDYNLTTYMAERDEVHLPGSGEEWVAIQCM